MREYQRMPQTNRFLWKNEDHESLIIETMCKEHGIFKVWSNEDVLKRERTFYSYIWSFCEGG